MASEEARNFLEEDATRTAAAVTACGSAKGAEQRQERSIHIYTFIYNSFITEFPLLPQKKKKYSNINYVKQDLPCSNARNLPYFACVHVHTHRHTHTNFT